MLCEGNGDVKCYEELKLKLSPNRLILLPWTRYYPHAPTHVHLQPQSFTSALRYLTQLLNCRKLVRKHLEIISFKSISKSSHDKTKSNCLTPGNTFCLSLIFEMRSLDRCGVKCNIQSQLITKNA